MCGPMVPARVTSGAAVHRAGRPNHAGKGDVVSDDLRELDEMGPVDYLVIEFPQFRMTGEGLKAPRRSR